jgi:hypothetical protein
VSFYLVDPGESKFDIEVILTHTSPDNIRTFGPEQIPSCSGFEMALVVDIGLLEEVQQEISGKGFP